MRILSRLSLKKLSKNFGNSCHHLSRVSSRFQRGGLKKKSNFLPLANLITFPNQHRSSKINFFPRKIRLLFIMKSEINAYKRKKKFDLPSRWNKLAWTGSNSHLESWADLFGNLPKQTADVYILSLSSPPLPLPPPFSISRIDIRSCEKNCVCHASKERILPTIVQRDKGEGEGVSYRITWFSRICLSNRWREGIRWERRFSIFTTVFRAVANEVCRFAGREQRRMFRRIVYFRV